MPVTPAFGDFYMQMLGFLRFLFSSWKPIPI